MAPVLRAPLLHDGGAGSQERDAELVMEEHVEPLAPRGQRDQHLVPEQLAGPRHDDFAHVGTTAIPAGLVRPAVEGDVFVVGVQLEQGVTQLPDVDALAVHVVDGAEHQADPQPLRGTRNRAGGGRVRPIGGGRVSTRRCDGTG
jgi:hypothetical protein